MVGVTVVAIFGIIFKLQPKRFEDKDRSRINMSNSIGTHTSSTSWTKFGFEDMKWKIPNNVEGEFILFITVILDGWWCCGGIRMFLATMVVVVVVVVAVGFVG